MNKPRGKLEKILYDLKHGSEYLNYGRDIITRQVITHTGTRTKSDNDLNILDVGAAIGADLLNIKRNLRGRELKLFGVECYKPYIEEATRNGICIFDIDIERQQLPLPDHFCDIIIANQIIEHTKEIFWIFGEISRVLKEHGIVIIGLPNLAALHNRLILLAGGQPTCIEPMSEHVRGFTKPAFERFIVTGGYFKLLNVFGSKFIHSLLKLAKYYVGCYLTCSTSLFYVVERTEKEGNYISNIDSAFGETPYYKGIK